MRPTPPCDYKYLCDYAKFANPRARPAGIIIISDVCVG